MMYNRKGNRLKPKAYLRLPYNLFSTRKHMEHILNVFLLLDLSGAALQALRKTSVNAVDVHRYCFNISIDLQHWSEI